MSRKSNSNTTRNNDNINDNQHSSSATNASKKKARKSQQLELMDNKVEEDDRKMPARKNQKDDDNVLLCSNCKQALDQKEKEKNHYSAEKKGNTSNKDKYYNNNDEKKDYKVSEKVTAPALRLAPTAYGVAFDRQGQSSASASASAAQRQEQTSTNQSNNNNSPLPPPPLQPGAYRQPGPDSYAAGTSAPTPQRLDRAPYHPNNNNDDFEDSFCVGEDNTVANGTVGTTVASPDPMTVATEAHMVSETETIMYAEDVKQDVTKRNYIIATCTPIIVIAIALTLYFTLRQNGSDGNSNIDSRCLLDLEDQNVLIRCYCTNSTNDFFDSLSEQAEKNYFYIQNALVDQNVDFNVTELEISNYNSCTVTNQVLLQLATLDEEGTIVNGIQGIPNQLVAALFALGVVFVEMGGLFWDASDNWLSTLFICDWYGVSCLSIESIFAVNLANNKLSGAIPSVLQHLDGLRELDLSSNPGITGTIPSELAYLDSLRSINLSGTSLSGTIATEFGNLDRLNDFDISNALLTGSIPTEFGEMERLESLLLYYNSLTGPIPSEFGNLQDAFWVDLKINSLTGSLPSELSQMKRLENFDVSLNDFTGTIPIEVGGMRELEYLNFYDSGIGGDIPQQLCDNLEESLLIVGQCRGDRSLNENSCTCCKQAFVGSAQSKKNDIRVFCRDDLTAEEEAMIQNDPFFNPQRPPNNNNNNNN